MIQENYLEMLNERLHDKFGYTDELREGITLDDINDAMQECDCCQEHPIIGLWMFKLNSWKKILKDQ